MKIIIAVNYFSERLHRRYLTGLKMCLGFWICLWFYVRVLNNTRVTRGSAYAWICLNNSWICLIIPEYAWIRLNMSEYSEICVNMPKVASMAFAFHFPIVIFCLLKLVVAYFNVYKKLGTWGCFLEETKFDIFFCR